MNKHKFFSNSVMALLISIFFSSAEASEGFVGCYAWEKDGVPIERSEAQRLKGFFTPALAITDTEIKIIVNKKIYGFADYQNSMATQGTLPFDRIDTYIIKDKNSKIEFDVAKSNNSLHFTARGILTIVMYTNFNSNKSVLQLHCFDLKK